MYLNPTHLKVTATLIAIWFLSPIIASAGNPDSTIHRSLVFNKGDGGSKFYRIPAIATAVDGSIIAVADRRWDSTKDLPGRIDVVMRRSCDNGETWSNAVTIAACDSAGGYGDPALVVDKRNGDILCIMTHGNGLWESTPDDHASIMVSRSSDNGKSWSRPTDITPQLFSSDSISSSPLILISAFATSGHALQLADGRLMFVLVCRDNAVKWSELKCYACFSDDGGYTWSVAQNPADTDGDEAKIVELNDGSLLMSIRNRRKGARKFSVSHDRGLTWSAPVHNSDIIEPGCNGDIIRYKNGDLDMLLHTVPADSIARRNVTIFVSADEGHSWQARYSICPAPSAYSSLTVLRNGTIGCLSEESAHDGGHRIWFTRLPVARLLPSH